jgi:hypothetical protein
MLMSFTAYRATFREFMVVHTKIKVLWDVTPYSLVESYQGSEKLDAEHGGRKFHLHSLYLEDGSSRIISNVPICQTT